MTWINIHERLPAMEERVVVHSSEKNWYPCVAWRAPHAGLGWTWKSETADEDFSGLEFWCPLDPLPAKDAAP